GALVFSGLPPHVSPGTPAGEQGGGACGAWRAVRVSRRGMLARRPVRRDGGRHPGRAPYSWGWEAPPRGAGGRWAWCGRKRPDVVTVPARADACGPWHGAALFQLPYARAGPAAAAEHRFMSTRTGSGIKRGWEPTPALVAERLARMNGGRRQRRAEREAAA